VLTEVTVKVMPRPETGCTLLVRAANAAAAVQAMTDALNSPHEVSAAAWLPETALKRSAVVGDQAATGGKTVLRLEGPAPSVIHRVDGLNAMFGTMEVLWNGDSSALWQEIGAVRALLGETACVWKLCPTPAESPALLERLKAQFGGVEAVVDWGGGLIWLGLDAEQAGSDAGAKKVRGAIATAGGHATLFAASPMLRADVDVFEPLAPALAALTARIKQGFDPAGILNPRRLAREF
jgi:glycolate oxidase FAD binding subunit